MLRRLSGLIAFTLILTSLTACSGEVKLSCHIELGKEPKSVTNSVATVMAPTTTFVNFKRVIGTAKTSVVKALRQDNSSYSVVVADGSPKQFSKSWVSYPDGAVDIDIDNEVSRTFARTNRAYKCVTSIEQDSEFVYPTVAESNILRGLELAADSFGASAATKSIFVMSNGIQTSGSFSMLDLKLDDLKKPAQIESFVSALKAQNALPDLKGADVHWYGLGVVDQVNQVDLETTGVQVLQNLWIAIVKASNGKISESSFNNSIPFDAPVVNSIAATAIEKPSKPCFITVREDDGLAFNPDQATFVDPSKAKSTATLIADQISSSKNCEGELKVTGYTASGVEKSAYGASEIAANKSLSLARAKAFVALLVSVGVKNKLIPVGGGKGSVIDWNADGSVNPELQKQNRIVTVSQ